MSTGEPMERARAVATEQRALPAGTWARVPLVGPAAARLVGRVLHPHAARQREATADLVRALDALARRVESVESAPPPPPPAAPPPPAPAVDLGPLHEEIAALRTQLADVRALLEGHARRVTGETAVLADGLRAATRRIAALEDRADPPADAADR